MQTDSADIMQFVNTFSAENGNVNSARPTDPEWWIQSITRFYCQSFLSFPFFAADCSLSSDSCSKALNNFYIHFSLSLLNRFPTAITGLYYLFQNLSVFFPYFLSVASVHSLPTQKGGSSGLWSVILNLTLSPALQILTTKVHWSARAINFNEL